MPRGQSLPQLSHRLRGARRLLIHMDRVVMDLDVQPLLICLAVPIQRRLGLPLRCLLLHEISRVDAPLLRESAVHQLLPVHFRAPCGTHILSTDSPNRGLGRGRRRNFVPSGARTLILAAFFW